MLTAEDSSYCRVRFMEAVTEITIATTSPSPIRPLPKFVGSTELEAIAATLIAAAETAGGSHE